jgi:hypothetical protein
VSARDEALDLIEKILPPEHAKAYRELFSKRFDAYAHELAEKQRAATFGNCDCGECEGIRKAADLIDPEVLNSE